MSVGHIVAIVVSILVIIGWIVVCLMHALGLIYGKYLLHRPLPQPAPDEVPGVSILKPLTGVDPNLYKNLESFFTLVFPAFELLFSVQDENDPAIMVVQSLIKKYPKVNAKLFIGLRYVGANNKVNNMVRGFEAAKYDLIAISDSAILMKPDTLMDMVSFMKPDVGLVVQMPYTNPRNNGFAGIYETVYFGTFQSRSSLSATCVGINCCTGMSCMFRREIVDNAGGLGAFANYLGEDYRICKETFRQNYKATFCSHPALQNSGNCSVAHFHSRLERWSQLRMSTLPHLLLLEPLSECMLMGVCFSFAMEFLFGFSAMSVFLLHVLLWFLSDYTLIKIVQGGQLPFSKFEFLVAWIIRETLSFWIMVKSQRTSTVTWRHKNYKLHWGGTISEI